MAESEQGQQQDPRKSAAAASMPRMGESTTVDYWFDMRVDDTTGVLTLTTFAYGLQIDQRDNSTDGAKDWAALIGEAAAAIQADIDAYGIAP